MASPKNDYNLFREICDIVSSDRLVCITGSGISSTLKQEKDKSKSLPTWLDLLLRMNIELSLYLNIEEKDDLNRLLTENASGTALIEAASILRNGRETKFDELFRSEVTPENRKTTETHRALLRIHPRGIITFNYDLAHENSINETGLSSNWEKLLPYDEEKIRKLLQNNLDHPFLLKAHGSIDSKEPLILTKDTYRDLSIKNPAYRAFVQNILTNFDLLIVGFSLNDPDFEMLIQDVIVRFGSAVRKIIVIRRETIGYDDAKIAKQKDVLARYQRDALLKRQLGIYTYYVDKYDDIPNEIASFLENSGPELERIINNCLSEDSAKRTAAHKELRQLGTAGKARASAVIREKICSLVRNNFKRDVWDLSELVYSLGKIDPNMSGNKKTLLYVIENSKFTEPVAHSLLALLEAFEVSDLKYLEKISAKIIKNPLIENEDNPDPPHRIATYIDFVSTYINAKYSSRKL